MRKPGVWVRIFDSFGVGMRGGTSVMGAEGAAQELSGLRNAPKMIKKGFLMSGNNVNKE